MEVVDVTTAKNDGYQKFAPKETAPEVVTVTKQIIVANGLGSTLAEACGLDPALTRSIKIECVPGEIVHVEAELYGTTDLEKFGWNTFFGEQGKGDEDDCRIYFDGPFLPGGNVFPSCQGCHANARERQQVDRPWRCASCGPPNEEG